MNHGAYIIKMLERDIQDQFKHFYLIITFYIKVSTLQFFLNYK